MPNHVNNYLHIEGSLIELTAFFDKASNKDQHGKDCMFTFNAFVPMPTTVFRGDLGQREELEFPGDFNWYGWSLKHWGTKWDCYQVVINKPFVRFQTAWSVPLPVLHAMSRQFPNLTITDEWIEETLESAGRIVLQGGEVVFDEHENYSAWASKHSKYIHALNRKYESDYYLSYLSECTEDESEDSIYAHYLKICQLENAINA